MGFPTLRIWVFDLTKIIDLRIVTMFGWATICFLVVMASGQLHVHHKHPHDHNQKLVKTAESAADQPSNKVTECRVAASMSGISQALVQASVKCARNAKIIVEAGDSLIDQVIVMKNLYNVEVSILGNLHLKPDWAYWAKNGYIGIPDYKNITMVWSYVDGTNVHVNGGGSFNGNGVSAWRGYYKSTAFARPLLVLFSGITDGSYSNLRHIDSPAWNVFLYKTHDFKVFNYQLEIHDGGAGSDSEAKNTDGCGIRDSSNIEIYNSRMFNTDDVVAVKTGSQDISVHDIIGDYRCGGISIGSLGLMPNVFETAKNITFDHIELRNCHSGPRVKAWAGRPAAVYDLSGGGGRGLMQDIIFKNINVKDVESGIIVETCFGVEKPNDDCFGAPTKVLIESLEFSNVVGTVRPKDPSHDSDLANIQCSAGKKGCPGLKVRDSMLVDAFNQTINPWHCAGLSQADLPNVLCDYPKFTWRARNGTVQLQIGPKPGVFGPLIKKPVLPVGYTNNIPAPDGVWKPKYSAAPKSIPFVQVSQPKWPEAWDAAVKDLVSPRPTS